MPAFLVCRQSRVGDVEVVFTAPDRLSCFEFILSRKTQAEENELAIYECITPSQPRGPDGPHTDGPLL